MHKKRYYPYYKYKLQEEKYKKRKKFFNKFLFLVLFIFVLYFSFRFSSQIKNFLKVEKIEIIFNNTTVPDNLISDFFITNNVSVFNFKKILEDLVNVHNEIEKIETNSIIPFKKLRLKIISRYPMFYTKENDKHIFISSKNEKFQIYNEHKIDFSKIIEIDFQNSFDFKKLNYLYQLLLTKNLIPEIQKIQIRKNNEYIIYFNNGNKIIFNDKFDEINLNQIFDVIILALNKKIDIYARLLNDGIIYIK